MADSVKLTLKATDSSDKTVTTTISNVNPESTNTELLTTAQMLNALTRNVYESTDKVETTNLDTASEKLNPTFSLSTTTLSRAAMSGTGTKTSDFISVTYNGDGNVYFDDATLLEWKNGLNITELSYTVEGVRRFKVSLWQGVDYTFPIELKVYTTETDNYTAAQVTITITA